MKNKVFIKILLLIVFLSNIQLSFSQVSADLMKYWYYRNRLKYFVVNGNKVGEGQIVCIRNRMGCDPRIDNPDGKGGNVDWGQPGKHDGYYIGVLATEYYLLEQNGQDTDAAHTLTELQNALTTFIVNWDEAAKTAKANKWPGYGRLDVIDISYDKLVEVFGKPTYDSDRTDAGWPRRFLEQIGREFE